MAFKLQICDNNLNLNFNVKYQNLSKKIKPEVEAHTPDNKIAKERTIYQDRVLPPGSTQRKWVDDDGRIFAKSELTFWYDGEQVRENTQTKVFNIEGYQPLRNYTDNYVISAYYELFPSTNDMKKDYDRERARITNLHGMKRLWDYLTQSQQVARGEFCVSSRGFLVSDGYIRPVQFENKWGLEIGLFKEEKIFEYLQESIPDIPQSVQVGYKKLKMV